MFDNINILAAIAAALIAFVIGGIWYSPKVFGSIWCNEMRTVYKDKKGHGKKIYLIALIGYLVSAFGFAFFLGPMPQLASAILTGLYVGVAWVATSFGINYIFAGRTLKVFLIDAGYHIAQFVIYGIVIGLWH
jgi:hypothetical protein